MSSSLRQTSARLLLLSALYLVPVEAQPLNDDSIKNLSSVVPAHDLFPPHFRRIEPAGTQDAGDYLPVTREATQGRNARFEHMPIPYVVQEPSNAMCDRALHKAVEDWQMRSNGLVSFVQVANPKDARIVIVWRHEGASTKLGTEYDGAHTQTPWHSFEQDGRTIVTAEPAKVDINLDVLQSKRPESREIFLENIIAHEIGHAVGLFGHSPKSGDLMFRDVDEFSRISQRDLNTLRRVYSVPAEIPL